MAGFGKFKVVPTVAWQSGQISSQPVPALLVTLNGGGLVGIPPKSPENSGLGIILICPDGNEEVLKGLSEKHRVEAFRRSTDKSTMTMADQICGEGCLKHVGRCGNRQSSPRLAVFGTPCDPFSKQRSKRWCDGSVKSHGDFATTFQDVYKLLEMEEPLIIIMEQVDGFDMPFSSTDKQTPRERPVKGGCLFWVGLATGAIRILDLGAGESTLFVHC